jgi:hypothetical protein
VVSSREFSEIWVIDHSTTTAQAAGHTGGRWGKGGDLLWRYGNPASWNGGTRANQALYFQHNAHWIESGKPGAGNILVFNNGWFRADGRSFSSVMEVRPAGYGRAQLVWQYVNPVTPQGPLARTATPPSIPIRGLNGVPNVFANLTFRSLRYAPTFAGFSGKILAAGSPIERP